MLAVSNAGWGSGHDNRPRIDGGSLRRTRKRKKDEKRRVGYTCLHPQGRPTNRDEADDPCNVENHIACRGVLHQLAVEVGLEEEI